MKRRSGFVSNSSSSSFIVGFERRPASVEEVHKILFNTELNEDSHVTYYDYSLPTKDVAERVFRDLKEQKPATVKKIKEEVRSGYFPGYPSRDYSQRTESELLEDEFHKKFPSLNYYDEKTLKGNADAIKMAKKIRETRQAEWDREREETDAAADRYAEESVLTKFKGKKVFVFSYADDGGEAVLEHGQIFDNLPHVQISHH